MEAYAARVLAASAEELVAGLGALVGVLVALVGEVTSAGMAGGSLDAMEQTVAGRGRELQRMVLQHALDAGQAGERRLAGVIGAEGVARTRVERGHARTVVSLFGPVVVRRMAYRAPGAANLHPRDGVLNLPPRRYSWGLQRQVVMHALAGSYEQARLLLAAGTGASVGKLQLEQIVAGAARDAPGFCPAAALGGAPGLPLALSVDGKGVAMRPEARRRRRGARGERVKTFGKRLGTGEKAGHKRMAEVGVVFDVQPCPPRSPEQIMGPAPRCPPPKATSRWYTADITAGRAATINTVFDQAGRRDPTRQRTWIALVDGDPYQITTIRAQAAQRGITITILIDFIHVLEYLWKTAWCFHTPRDPAAETWVTAQGLAILHGHTAQVTALIETLALDNPPEPGSEHDKQISKTLTYLTAKQPYLDYPTALAQGWPIATGVIEGACRHLVNDRMGITGARWGLPGAQAILSLRAIHTNGDLNTYWAHHTTCEHQRNHLSRYQDSPTLAA